MVVERWEKIVGYGTRVGSEGSVGVTVEVGSARAKATVRDAVERREKMPRRVWRGEESEDARIYVRGCRRDVWYGRRRDGELCAIAKDV